MAVSAYEVISTQTLDSAIADVFFTSIPQTYTDLVLVISSTMPSYSQTAFRVNGDSGSNYSYTELWGTGSFAQSGRASSTSYGRLNNYGGAGTTSSDILIANFMNYSNTTTYKTVIDRNGNANSAAAGSGANVCLWRSTAAITSINILSTLGTNFSVGSTFTLYGIKAA